MAEAVTTIDEASDIPALRITRQMAAPREAVFAALTKPEALMKWFGPDGATTKVADVDLRPGGRYRFEMHGSEGGIHSVGGVYREIDPPARLVFTWVWEQTHLDLVGRETLVTIELVQRESGTELTLIHEGLRDAEHREQHGWGWNSGFDCLDTYLAAA
ncbi:MAG: SRPBCC domain-containing protein [Alphaproteobacteria bacterium]|nr:SRPBCC domain-containing protein [Alphaproteobacteria bacterium]